jgi:hypothetical protein
VIGTAGAARQVSIVRLPAQTANASTRLVWRPAYRSVALEALKKLLPA